MYERLDNCPLCNSGQFYNKVITKDHSVSGESFAIVECENCKLNFTNPRPSKEDIGTFYASEQYISHSNKTRSIYDLIYKIVRLFTLKNKLALINQLNTKKTILDFGCGTGNFLQKCADSKWQVTGVEPNEIARKQAQTLIKKPVYEDLKGIPDKEQFHIITLWHVLEHIHDLQDTLNFLKGKLKKNGYMVIALPNQQSWDAVYYKEFWAGYDVPRHLYHFNPETFKKLAKTQKLKLVKTIPQKMDAFYISLLSEKYKSGFNKPYNALLKGIKSNQNAKISKMYSSLAYILQR